MLAGPVIGQDSAMTLPSGDEVRAEADAFVDEHWNDTITVGAWWALLAQRGYTLPDLAPEDGGRGWGPDLVRELNGTLTRRRALGPPGGLGLMLAAPTIAAYGTPEQKRTFLPPILDGSHGWCQLFSEPQAGSDLAGLQTRAERDGDEWVVSGQKVWTSTAQTADWGILIARTDPDAPKHLGITYFAFPMRQPGVEVRPLVEMTGRALFNEVFLDGARVRDEWILGELNGGWKVANATLGFERTGIGHTGAASFAAAAPGSVAGHLDRPAASFVGRRGGLGVTMVSKRTVTTLRDLAASTGRQSDPVIRQKLAKLHTNAQLGPMVNWWKKADPASRTSSDGSLAKLRTTEALRFGRDLSGDLLGPALGIVGDDSETGGYLQELTLFSPAPSIYGGTDEVQRNLIGERGLGLPKEPGPAKDTPFRALPKN